MSTVEIIHKTTVLSISKILAKNNIDEFQVQKFEKWTDIKFRLDEIKHVKDYFLALKMASALTEDAIKFIKEKRKAFYGKF